MKVPTLLGLFAVLVLSGCGSLFGPAATRTPPLQIEQAQEPQEARPGNRWLGTQFEDIPAPTDFTLDYDASYVSISAQGCVHARQLLAFRLLDAAVNRAVAAQGRQHGNAEAEDRHSEQRQEEARVSRVHGEDR